MGESRTYTRGVVATPHYLASAAGAAVLADGGNAMDAIIAANLALGVVAPYYCGYGGDLLAMVWADDVLSCYRSTGRAPMGATVDAVRRASGAESMPAFGPHAVTVPGAVQGWFDLLARFGTRSFGALSTAARRYAADGFVPTAKGADYLAGCRALYPGFEALQAMLAGAREGVPFHQPGLVRTIERLAADGPDAYYRGPIAEAIADELQEQGGFMTTADLAAHTADWVEPLSASFRGAEVFEMPPPTQGVTALEALRILDGLDLGPDDVERHHVMIEAVKLALADRDEHVGDPAAMTIDPRAMLDDAWIARRRAAIDRDHAAVHPSRAERADGGTAYLCAADADGMAVSLIQSNFTAIGSGVHVPEWGINLHNRGSAFLLREGHANSLGPGKMPLHTLVPSMSFVDGRPWLVFGTMGGHGQAQTHAQVLTRLRVDDADVQDAISAPRWEVNPDTWRVSMEARFPADWIENLRGRGQHTRVARAFDDGMGHAHAIELAQWGMRAASDPRCEGAALGW